MKFGPNPLAQPIGLTALATVTGLVTEPWQPDSVLVVFLCIAQAVLIGWLFRKKPSSTQVFFRDIFLWLAVALLAGQWLRLNQPTDSPELKGAQFTFRAMVSRVDRIPGKGATVDFQVKELLTDRGWVLVHTGIRMRADSATAPFWFEGVGYELTAHLSTPEKATNFNDFDYRQYLNNNGIWFTLFSSDIQAVRRCQAKDDLFRLLTGTIRLWVEKTIAHSIPTADGQGFARGLLLGSRSWIDKDWLQAYSQTGTLHILSVSGLHAGMVAMIFYFPLIRLRCLFPRFGEVIRVLLTIMGLVFYGHLTGWPVSMTRALLMASALLSTTLINRHKESWSPWFLAMTVVLWVDPTQLSEPGFLLSFLAVSMVISSGKLLKAFPHSEKIGSVGKNLAITLFALVGTAPVTLAFFKNLPLAGSVANLIVIPLTGLILISSLLTVLTAPIEFVSGVFGNTVSVLSAFSGFVVEMAVNLPHSFTRLDISTGFWPILFAILAGGIIATVWFSSRIPLILSVMVAAPAIVWKMDSHQPLTVSVLDAGQGDCLIIHAGNKLAVIDGGPKKNGNKPVASSIESAIYARGFTSIPCLVISHPHADHYAGLLRTFIKIDTVFTGDTTGAGSMFTQWLMEISSRGTIVEPVTERRKINLGVEKALYIINGGLNDKNLNNNSLFVRIQDGKHSLLSFGDAESDLEERMIRSLPPEFLNADVLKVSHHGSKTSSSEPFLAAVSPTLAIISCAAVNSYGHPDPGTIQRLKTKGIHCLRTPVTGEIRLTNGTYGWQAEHFIVEGEPLLLSVSSGTGHQLTQSPVHN